MIPPESSIGIIGGGQLGRMLSLAAARLGYRCHILDPHARPCAADVAAGFIRAGFDDAQALARLGEACAVVTYEFENVPVAPLAVLGDTLRPGARSLEIAQDRAVEKAFLEGAGARVAPWARIDREEDLDAALERLGLPLVIKTRRLGYDGKGQAWVRSADQLHAAWDAVGRQPAIAEAGIAFEAEYSVVLARTLLGETRAFPIARNDHQSGILRRSTVPAGPLVEGQAAAAIATAAAVATAMGHVGVLTVEFFAGADGPIVNEVAPRVHNSGHWTIEGARTSQFEQHIRAICGLPLGDPGLVAGGAVMDNLIGDEIDAWPELMAQPGVAVHHYGKGEARPGRKMGHTTRVL